MISSRIINESKLNHGADLNTKSKARDLRKNATVAEKILWNHLRNRQIEGYYFRRQHPYAFYILDFYCQKAELVIEIDGKIHLETTSYDKERTEFLESTGITVLRFKNEDVENKIEWVLKKIRTILTDNQNEIDSI
jgi:very-short-patch-repair endonuclease